MELSNIFSWTFMYDFIRGPMVWISFIVFIFGTIFQVLRFMSLIKEQKIMALKPGPGNIIYNQPASRFKKGWVKTGWLKKGWFKAAWLKISRLKTGWFKKNRTKKDQNGKDWLLWLKLSIAGVNPFMTIVSIVFHVLLIFVPVFVLGHNILLDNAFGISMVSLPENVSDFLTGIVIFCTLIFLFRRLFLDRVKIITSYEDYFFLILAAAPFVTGYFAYHQVFLGYKLVISLHILSGELMLMAVPFTKFIHMIYIIIVRFNVAGEYSLGNARKNW
jgi:nitrate reductase gamma subunit